MNFLSTSSLISSFMKKGFIFSMTTFAKPVWVRFYAEAARKDIV